MKSKVYTLTGDSGTTALVGGRRVSKDDVRVEAYGTIDELNAHIGLLAQSSQLADTGMTPMVVAIMNKLFNIGAYLATDSTGADTQVYGLSEADVQAVERAIDEMDEELPPFRGFVLPGGSRLSARCDVCRTVARRAERRIVALAHTAAVNPIVLKYVNRLSDFFYVLARFNNLQSQIEENYWDKNA